MIHNRKYKIALAFRVIVLLFVCAICLAPFYVAICYAFKSKVEFARTRLAFPTSLYLGNFIECFGLKNYFNSIKNSAIVAFFVVLFIVLFCSAAAYMITRKKNRFYNTIYYFFQLVILIPFQTIMFPLYKQIFNMHILNTLPGVILAELGVYTGYYVFMYSGFIKSVPISLEEAAEIDGCNRYQVFMKIVFPLLKPITMTVIVLCFLASWNDFFLPMVMCQKEIIRTLPLMQFYFFGEYSNEINLAFAAALVAMVPTVIVYFMAQKYIVAGMTAGAVKS